MWFSKLCLGAYSISALYKLAKTLSNIRISLTERPGGYKSHTASTRSPETSDTLLSGKMEVGLAGGTSNAYTNHQPQPLYFQPVRKLPQTPQHRRISNLSQKQLSDNLPYSHIMYFKKPHASSRLYTQHASTTRPSPQAGQSPAIQTLTANPTEFVAACPS